MAQLDFIPSLGSHARRTAAIKRRLSGSGTVPASVHIAMAFGHREHGLHFSPDIIFL